jgi:hypothetical protein
MEALAVFLETEGLATLAAPRRPSLTVLEGSGITLLVHLESEFSQLREGGVVATVPAATINTAPLLVGETVTVEFEALGVLTVALSLLPRD